MRPRYVILSETDYDVTNGHSSYSIVKVFKNERDAFVFYNDPKNIRAHGGLYLEYYDANGHLHEWDETHKEWKAG